MGEAASLRGDTALPSLSCEALREKRPSQLQMPGTGGTAMKFGWKCALFVGLPLVLMRRDGVWPFIGKMPMTTEHKENPKSDTTGTSEADVTIQAELKPL